MEVISIDGHEFVKASAAARQAGYTPDYVGQLARAGAVPARLIGRTWYVDAEVLRTHKVEKKRFAREKAREQVKKALEERKATLSPLEAARSGFKRVPVYAKDEHDLIPAIEKIVAEPPVEAVVIPQVKQNKEGEYKAQTVTIQKKEESVPKKSANSTKSHRQVIAPRKKEAAIVKVQIPDVPKVAVAVSTPIPEAKKKASVRKESEILNVPSTKTKRISLFPLVIFLLSMPMALVLASLEIHTIHSKDGILPGTATEYVINIGALRSALLDPRTYGK